MTLRDLRSEFREALAVQDALRKLGFSADDLYLLLMLPHVGVVLRTQGREIVFRTGTTELSEQAVRELWREATEAWNTATEPEMRRVWNDSQVCARKVEFLVSLSEAGVVIPVRRGWDDNQQPFSLN